MTVDIGSASQGRRLSAPVGVWPLFAQGNATIGFGSSAAVNCETRRSISCLNGGRRFPGMQNEYEGMARRDRLKKEKETSAQWPKRAVLDYKSYSILEGQ